MKACRGPGLRLQGLPEPGAALKGHQGEQLCEVGLGGQSRQPGGGDKRRSRKTKKHQRL